MKRFWQTANVTAAGTGHSVMLDGRPVKLPGGSPLTISSRALAEAIAEEWAVAPDPFSAEDLPLTRLASTAQEHVPAQRDNIIEQLAAYGMNDLLCYRAEAPAELAALQRQSWDPWLAWAEEICGASFRTTCGLVPIDQPPEFRGALRVRLAAQTDSVIAALGVIVPALGSLVLGLALAADVLDVETACKASFLDETWQEEHWGIDQEAAKRRAKIAEDVDLSVRFMRIARQ